MTQQLKPCPFCGNPPSPTPTLLTVDATFRAAIECGTCLARGPVVSSDRGQEEAERLAVILWNNRDEELDTPISRLARTKYDPVRGWYTEPVTYQQKPVEEWILKEGDQ